LAIDTPLGERGDAGALESDEALGQEAEVGAFLIAAIRV